MVKEFAAVGLRCLAPLGSTERVGHGFHDFSFGSDL
jgi:hypothetical protein